MKEYTVKVNGKVQGIAGEYIDRISRLADINFKYKKYQKKRTYICGPNYKNADRQTRAFNNKNCFCK